MRPGNDDRLKILALSDTHLTNGEPLPPPLAAALATADLILHAGDITSHEAYRRISACGRLVAVRGNMDHFPLDEMLREREIVETPGLRIGIVHGGGSPHDIESRVASSFGDEPLDLILFGHTHRAAVTRVGGRLLVNPGSASPAGVGSRGSYALIGAGTAGGAPTVEFVNF